MQHDQTDGQQGQLNQIGSLKATDFAQQIALIFGLGLKYSRGKTDNSMDMAEAFSIPKEIRKKMLNAYVQKASGIEQ